MSDQRASILEDLAADASQRRERFLRSRGAQLVGDVLDSAQLGIPDTGVPGRVVTPPAEVQRQWYRAQYADRTAGAGGLVVVEEGSIPRNPLELAGRAQPLPDRGIDVGKHDRDYDGKSPDSEGPRRKITLADRAVIK